MKYKYKIKKYDKLSHQGRPSIEENEELQKQYFNIYFNYTIGRRSIHELAKALDVSAEKIDYALRWVRSNFKVYAREDLLIDAINVVRERLKELETIKSEMFVTMTDEKGITKRSLSPKSENAYIGLMKVIQEYEMKELELTGLIQSKSIAVNLYPTGNVNILQQTLQAFDKEELPLEKRQSLANTIRRTLGIKD